LDSNLLFRLNKDGTIETDGDGADDDDGEAGPSGRPADARRLRDLELLAAGEAEGLSEEMRGSIARTAGRLCAIENKGMNTKQAAAILPDYERRVADRLTEIAPALAELVRGGEMKSGRAVAGMMGELNKGMPRAPVNHLRNLESGLQKLMTSLHLWEELPDEEAAGSRRRRMTKCVGQLAPHFPLEWRKALLAAWREGGARVNAERGVRNGECRATLTERLAKLLRLAERGLPHEAAVALAKARRLAAQLGVGLGAGGRPAAERALWTERRRSRELGCAAARVFPRGGRVAERGARAAHL
jgi:hypothetical protein